MTADRKFALRMIPYGVFIATAANPSTLQAAAVTVHWVTQTAFEPCLLAASLPASHPALHLARQTGRFALHMLGKADAEMALAFSRPPPGVAVLDAVIHRGNGATLGGYPCNWGRRGCVLFGAGVAVLECEVRAVLEAGDHHPLIGEAIDFHVRLPQHRRPDEMILHLRDLGETIFYGG